MSHADVIDRLAGIAAGSRLDRLRDERVEARRNAQASYQALFEPADFGTVPQVERLAVAAFVAGLHRQPAAAEYYARKLAGTDPRLAAVIAGEIEHARDSGPWGHYPEGPLSAEDRFGPLYRPTPAIAGTIGVRLAAALAHAHLLVYHPRDADPASLQRLADAGWATADIVTLSQLVAFLSFQIRVVAGLTALAAAKPSLEEAA